jgi:hypothetical protein
VPLGNYIEDQEHLISHIKNKDYTEFLFWNIVNWYSEKFDDDTKSYIQLLQTNKKVEYDWHCCNRLERAVEYYFNSKLDIRI